MEIKIFRENEKYREYSKGVGGANLYNLSRPYRADLVC
nr:MAG TPA: hypothetical protein [Caudoviricetes sp.]